MTEPSRGPAHPAAQAEEDNEPPFDLLGRPVFRRARSTSASDESESEDDSESESSESGSEAPVYRLPRLNEGIRLAIKKYGGAVFPKLNWTSPKVGRAWVVLLVAPI
jgi:hypothetical protein